mmetsp:Transcript_16320/g.37254  ORF Transcript_16320/g.37254 Transcript_16320/m.37254 type:complete len:102 (-) Transcript_16320:860-1165(-)
MSSSKFHPSDPCYRLFQLSNFHAPSPVSRRTLSWKGTSDGRLPTLTTVMPSSCNSLYICSSFSRSRALVDSSRMTNFGLRIMMRAKASRCCSPRDKMLLSG